MTPREVLALMALIAVVCWLADCVEAWQDASRRNDDAGSGPASGGGG